VVVTLHLVEFVGHEEGPPHYNVIFSFLTLVDRLLFPVDQEDVDRSLLPDYHHYSKESESKDYTEYGIEDLIREVPFVHAWQQQIGILLELVSHEPVPGCEEYDPEHDARPDIEKQVEESEGEVRSVLSLQECSRVLLHPDGQADAYYDCYDDLEDNESDQDAVPKVRHILEVVH
jgi:hypothetical protein